MKSKEILLLGFSLSVLFPAFITHTLDAYFTVLMVEFIVYLSVIPGSLNKKTKETLIILSGLFGIILLTVMLKKYLSIINSL
jgi:hypothetical protein